LSELYKAWRRIASDGYCSMNYVVGRWLCLRTGEEDKGPDWKPCLSLSNTVSKLFRNKRRS
jgi:hypothetical protein